MKKPFSIAFLGGDERQKYAAAALAKHGDDVWIWGLGAPQKGMKTCETAIEVIGSCEIVVLPIRVTIDGQYLYCPLQKEVKLPLAELSTMLPKNTTVLSGDLPCYFREKLIEREVLYSNYWAREELQIKNALFTAEGALALAVTELPIAVLGSKIAVLGYGRIAKFLTALLRNMGAEVTVFARKESDLATAKMHGISTVSFYQDITKALINDFNLIYNTVPQVIINENILSQIRQDCQIIDLASAPGGIDFRVAEQHGIKTIWATGLPGKTAPKSAGEAVAETIVHLLAEGEK